MFNKDIMTSLAMLSAQGDRKFLRLPATNSEFTCAEIFDMSARIAKRLNERSCTPYTILLVMDNSVEVICTVVAALAMRISIVQVPAVGDIVEKIQLSCGLLPQNASSVVAGSDQYLTKVGTSFEYLNITEIIKSEQKIEGFLDRESYSNYRFMTQLSSGTTGHPKGITIDSDQLSHNLIDIVERMKLNSSSVIVSWLPLYHDMGLMSLMLALFSGAPIHLLTPYSFVRNPIIWLKEITQYGGTHAGVPNFALRILSKMREKAALAEIDLKSLEYLLVGSDMAYVDSLDAFENKYSSLGLSALAVKPSYGLAENVVAVSLLGADERRTFLKVNHRNLFSGARIQLDEDGAKLSCAGRPLSNTHVSVWHEGLKCADGVIGDICIHGRSTTREIIEVNGATNFDLDEPLHTGDVGFLWNGRLYLVGRKKSLIKTMGRSFYPEVIESKLKHEHPEYESIAIMQLPNYASGADEVIAILESKSVQRHLATENHLSADVVSSVLNVKRNVLVSHEMQITKMLVSKLAMPKTSSGKVARQKVAADLIANPERYFQVC